METQASKIDKRKFFVNIIIPTFLTVGLFMVLIFAFIIPYFELNLVKGKKEMIREIVNASICIASKYDKDAQEGKISVNEAMKFTKTGIESLRYGINNKDYLWITDNYPVMIMHPYRIDLNGKDLTGFIDPLGKKLFVEIVRVVKRNGEGYVDYMWQWMDDSTRIVPKISYVKEYKPWGWIIGTGVYIEDVRKEISGIKKLLIIVSIGISFIMALMLTIIVSRNLKVEKQRCNAENKLKESREKYKALVEASIDGTLMFLDNKCIYSNKKMVDILPGQQPYNLSEDLHEIIHPDNESDVKAIQEFIRNNTNFIQFESVILNNNSSSFVALISISKIILSDKNGLIFIIKDLSSISTEEEKSGLELFVQKYINIKGIGIFNALPGKKGRFTLVNDGLVDILGFTSKEELLKTSILDLMDNHTEKSEFFNYVSTYSTLSAYPMKIKNKAGLSVSILVYAIAERNNKNEIENILGLIIDMSQLLNEQAAKDDILNKLLSSRSFFYNNVKSFLQKPTYCSENTSLRKAIELMLFYNTDKLLVKTDTGNVTGIVSEKEIVKSILNNSIDLNSSIYKIVNSSLFYCDENEPLSEAVNKMKSNNISTFIVRQNDNGIVGIHNSKNLLENLLNLLEMECDQIHHITSLEQLISYHNKLNVYVKSIINSGAKVSTITHVVTRCSDLIILKLIDIVISEIGEPPAKFAFIALGSEGRKEQTLLTDQDNAIIYDNAFADNENAKQYFIHFGKRINDLLHQVGYALCKGDIMAGNHKWNKPLSVWQKYFTEWILNAEPQHIVDISVFFDYRHIYGDTGLTDDLRKTINVLLADHPNFYVQMAFAFANSKIPIGFFGRIQTDNTEDSAGTINIKNASRIFVGLIRLYAMKNRIDDTNTIHRLNLLYASGAFSNSFYLDLAYSFDFLLMTQFRYQSFAISKNIHLDNNISLSFLSNIEVNTLKTIFSNIAAFQNKLKYDFFITS